MKKLMSLMSMSGRNVLITGGNGHIGAIISETLAEMGANLILIDKPNSNFKKLTNRINKLNNIKIRTLNYNLEDEKERINLFNKINKDYKNINCIINCAAYLGKSNISGWSTDFKQQSLDSWRKSIELNLTSIFHLSQLFENKLKLSKGANIINISSIYGEFAPDWRLYKGTNIFNPAGYSVSKGGLNQLTKWLASRLAPKIRVNAISPGGILRGQDQKFIDRYVKNTPLKRMATELDLKGASAFLASDLSQYVTGQIVKVDGGWGIW